MAWNTKTWRRGDGYGTRAFRKEGASRTRPNRERAEFVFSVEAERRTDHPCSKPWFAPVATTRRGNLFAIEQVCQHCGWTEEEHGRP